MTPQDLKDAPKVINVLRFQLALNHHVVYVNLNVVSKLRLKHPDHHHLIGKPRIL